MKVSTAKLRQDVCEALVAIGAPRQEAEVGAEMCLDAELRGHSSHGVRLLRNIAAAYEQGAGRRRAMRVVAESPVSARLDGGFHLSWFVHWSAIELVIDKALTMGIAVVSVVHERIDARGNILKELDEEAVRSAVQELGQAGIENIVVISYRNPSRERWAAEIVSDVPDIYLSRDPLAEALSVHPVPSSTTW
jgi:LDH2 family malate/lactate/ureidoglycolate dehydrogenase